MPCFCIASISCSHFSNKICEHEYQNLLDRQKEARKKYFPKTERQNSCLRLIARRIENRAIVRLAPIFGKKRKFQVQRFLKIIQVVTDSEENITKVFDLICPEKIRVLFEPALVSSSVAGASAISIERLVVIVMKFRSGHLPPLILRPLEAFHF